MDRADLSALGAKEGRSQETKCVRSQKSCERYRKLEKEQASTDHRLEREP